MKGWGGCVLFYNKVFIFIVVVYFKFYDLIDGGYMIIFFYIFDL